MFDRLRVATAFAEIPEQELIDSLEILDQQHLIKIARVLGAPLSHVVLTDYGFQQYAEAYIADYQDVVARVTALLVNESVCQNGELAERVSKPVAFVDFVLKLRDQCASLLKACSWQADCSSRRTISTERDRNIHRCTPLLAGFRRSRFSLTRGAPKLVMSKAVPDRCRFEP